MIHGEALRFDRFHLSFIKRKPHAEIKHENIGDEHPGRRSMLSLIACIRFSVKSYIKTMGPLEACFNFVEASPCQGKIDDELISSSGSQN